MITGERIALAVAGATAAGALIQNYAFLRDPLLRFSRALWRRRPGAQMAIDIAAIRKELTLSNGDSIGVKLAHIYEIIRDNRALALTVSREVRLVSEQLGIALVLTNEYGMVTFANQAYLDLVGLTADEVTGGGWKNVIHPDQRRAVADEWAACIKEGRDFRGGFAVVNGKTGVAVQVVATAYTVRSNNEVLGWVGHIRPDPSSDITWGTSCNLPTYRRN